MKVQGAFARSSSSIRLITAGRTYMYSILNVYIEFNPIYCRVNYETDYIKEGYIDRVLLSTP